MSQDQQESKFEIFQITNPEQVEQIVNMFEKKREEVPSAFSKPFQLDAGQVAKLEAWNKTQNDILIARDGGIKSGACGGHVSIRFTPTFMGIAIHAENCLTKNTIDLSNYDEW